MWPWPAKIEQPQFLFFGHPVAHQIVTNALTLVLAVVLLFVLYQLTRIGTWTGGHLIRVLQRLFHAVILLVNLISALGRLALGISFLGTLVTLIALYNRLHLPFSLFESLDFFYKEILPKVFTSVLSGGNNGQPIMPTR